MRRLWGDVAFRPPSRFLREAGLDRGPGDAPWGRRTGWSHSVMSAQDVRIAAPGLPRVSPSRLEAWDRCPAAYRFEHVLRLPQPIGDQRPRLLGSVAHALLEEYLREALRTGTRPPLATVSALAAALVEEGDVPDASTELIREAAELVTRWLAQWAVPVEHLVAVEHALAVDASGRRVAWDAPDAFIRGRLDLVSVEQQHATVLDWKSGWVSEDEEGLRVAWAPGLYAALLWAWAPRLEQISVEYHYLRTGRVARVVLTRADAAETLAWARALASRIAVALATPEDPRAFPPRPSTACGTCPWVNRCPAGQAALEAMAEGPIPDDAEARRLAGLLLAGEARVGRLRERLKAVLAGPRAPDARRPRARLLPDEGPVRRGGRLPRGHGRGSRSLAPPGRRWAGPRGVPQAPAGRGAERWPPRGPPRRRGSGTGRPRWREGPR